MNVADALAAAITPIRDATTRHSPTIPVRCIAHSLSVDARTRTRRPACDRELAPSIGAIPGAARGREGGRYLREDNTGKRLACKPACNAARARTGLELVAHPVVRVPRFGARKVRPSKRPKPGLRRGSQRSL